MAAFVGYFNRGPLNTPIQIFNVGGLEGEFGGATSGTNRLPYAEFFINGGSVAWVIRVTSGAPAAAAATLRAGDNADSEAATEVIRVFAGRQVRGRSVEDPGLWGNSIRIAVDYSTRAPDDVKLFNVSVSEVASQDGRRVVLRSESFPNCSIDPASSDYVIEKVNAGSQVVQLALADPDETLQRPAQTGTTGGAVDKTVTFTNESTLRVSAGRVDAAITLFDLTSDTSFDSGSALLRRALEKAIRKAGVDAVPADPHLSGAVVTVQNDAFRIVTGGSDRAEFDATLMVTFAEEDGNVARDLGLLGGQIADVQQYQLGLTTDGGYQTGGVAGDNGELPDDAALVGSFDAKTGMYALRDVDLFNILVLPSAVAPHRSSKQRPSMPKRWRFARRSGRSSSSIRRPGSTRPRRSSTGSRTPAFDTATPRCTSRGAGPRPAQRQPAAQRRAPAARSPASTPAPTPSAASGRRRPGTEATLRGVRGPRRRR